MKTILFLLFLYSSQALAATDKFGCELSFKGAAGNPSFSEFKEIEITRFLEQSEFDAFTKTSSINDFTVSEKSGYGLIAGVSYLFYTPTLVNSKYARFSRCISLYFISPSGVLEFECLQPGANPFDSGDSTWSTVSILNGVARFPIRSWQMNVPLIEGDLYYRCDRY